MADRERKRSERRKRKERGLERAPANGDSEDPKERMTRAYARAEERNREVREGLQPLHDGERPTVVTVGAILSAVIAVSIWIGYAAGVEVDGGDVEFIQVLAPSLLFGLMAWGMWRARYWAVLGFQVILLFLIFSAAWGLALVAGSFAQILANLGLLVVSGTFFVLMVKAMARIQMPQRLPRD